MTLAAQTESDAPPVVSSEVLLAVISELETQRDNANRRCLDLAAISSSDKKSIQASLTNASEELIQSREMISKFTAEISRLTVELEVFKRER